MSPLSWLLTLSVCLSKYKHNFDPDICCPFCSERNRISRFGFYLRNRYDSSWQKEAVQRYACGNGDCPRCTFSVLPHPYLPQVRLPICVLFELYRRSVLDAEPIGRLARALGHSWNTIRRAVDLVRRLLQWICREIGAGMMTPWPCLPDRWPSFCRLYSYAFMPGRFSPLSTNTIR